MGTYEQYLLQMLSALRVYDLTEGTAGRAALAAAGTGLDDLDAKLTAVEREALTATAEDVGLARREAVFARHPAAETASQRRSAIAALLQIDQDSLTPSAINRTLGGCGIRARAEEMGSGLLRIVFPETAGIPAEFDQIKSIILDILPLHLDVEFYFRYLTWQECEAAEMTWDSIELAEHTWQTLELAVPSES